MLKKPGNVVEKMEGLEKKVKEQEKAIKDLTPPKPAFKNSDSSTRETRDELHTQRKVKVNIPITESEQDDVVVQINGYAFQIKRGVDVEVPESVVGVLEDAKIMTYGQITRADGEGKELVAQESQRIPFSVKR